ncbi:hypothetical protein CI109_103652 [Kwoniella shandongensis]|uniref:Uncharacterized protein n=1 Tax=Kwoniella shandongensis TaxID=1734106 RepID=A0A5M6CBC0_9TREE|nr:uncharacterized protein CI109_000654 [Kwoniella shandongensis]KAA5531082.1 hypothetical protein CI109_000654 [Kwoniella shandongensis]
MVIADIERLSDVVKLSAHVTRVLGQNPGMMTLQGTNSYLLQPPSNPLAPLILIDTSSPHTASQYVDLLMLHLHHLGLESGIRETHFDSVLAQAKLDFLVPEDKVDEVKQSIVKQREEDPLAGMGALDSVVYGPASRWAPNLDSEKYTRKLPHIEHIILTHRHLDHVGALPALLTELKKKDCPPPKIWKFPSPDETTLVANERGRPTSDAEIWNSLPKGTFHPFSPLQPFHPIIPGLMISIIDPNHKHLLKYDKTSGKARWNEVPEIARVSLRCLRTPGHTKDSVSLVMLEGEKGVFTGDTVLGAGTTQFEDLQSYMTSLRTLLALKPNVLYPAHGPHIPGAPAARAHIETYIAHRQAREDQIVEVLKRFSGANATTTIEDETELEDVTEKESSSGGDDETKVDPSSEDKDDKDKDKDNHDKEEKEEKTEKEKEQEKIHLSPLASALIRIKREIHIHEEKINDSRGPDMIDKRKSRPMPDFEDEKKTLAQIPSSSTTGEDKDGARGQLVPLSMILRYLYKSEEPKLLFAAAKGISSHLVKLENEGKARKGKVKWCKLVGKEVGEVEEMDGWEWIGEDEDQKEQAKSA